MNDHIAAAEQEALRNERTLASIAHALVLLEREKRRLLAEFDAQYEREWNPNKEEA
jgi:hypothetical protein